jgi:hypothetical protein
MVCFPTALLALMDDSQGVTFYDSRTITEVHSTDETLIAENKNSAADMTSLNAQRINTLCVQTSEKQQTFL